MSEQVFPTVPNAPAPPAQYASSRMSVWRIAAAVFVGNFFCALLWFVLYFCFIIGVGLLGSGVRR